nr:MAG TPA: hypothetical protein [Caudoviricetes sp.]
MCFMARFKKYYNSVLSHRFPFYCLLLLIK